MFRTFSSFRDFIARLQAEQDARAQAIVDEGRESTVTVRTGDDVTGGSDLRSNIITVTQVGDDAVITGDVPDNADLTVRVGGEVVEPILAADPVIEEPVFEEPTLVQAESVVERQTVTVRSDGNGGVTVEGELPENAVLQVGPVNDNEPRETGVTIIENTQQVDPAPIPEGLVLEGGAGRDVLRGGEGNDVISGGAGRDRLDGFAGDDVFIFNTGDGRDTIANFELLGDNDTIQLGVDGINSLDDVLGTLTTVRDAGDAVAATFDFGGGDSLTVILDSVDSLTQDDFLFG